MAKSYCALILLIVLSFSCSAGETVKSLRRKSQEADQRTSYRARVTITTPRGSLTEMCYQRANPDGTVDKLSQYADDRQMLKNAKGHFHIIGDTAIRMDFLEMDTPRMLAPIKPELPTKKDENTIVVQGNEYKREHIGEDNWKIMENMTRPEYWQELVENATASNAGTIRELIFDGAPCYLVKETRKTNEGDNIEETILDKKTFLTRKATTYDSKGKIIYASTYADLVVDPIFDETIFELPQNAIILIAKSDNDYTAYCLNTAKRLHRQPSRTQASYSSALPGWFSGIFSQISHFVLNSPSLGYYLILQSLVIGMAVYVFRRKYRNKKYDFSGRRSKS